MKPYEELKKQMQELRLQLEEANDTIDAIRSGEVDALVVKDKEGLQLFTLRSADQTYRIFIEQMTEGAITLSEDNLILYCNSQFASLVNLPLQKITGQPFFLFLHPKSQAECVNLIAKAWQENTKGEFILLSGEESVPVQMSFKALQLNEGLSMSIIITDLTVQKENQKLLQLKNSQLEEAQKIAQQLNANLELKVKERTAELEAALHQKTEVQKELINNQERLSLILETMAEGVVIIDTACKMTYANPMAQRLLGIAKSDVQTRTYNDSKWQNLNLDGSPLPFEEHPMCMMLQNLKPVFDYEIAIQAPEKDRAYISINAAPMYNSAGELIGGVGTFMDVTNRRRITQQKDEFISVASHELKTPMTTLKASLQVLERIIVSENESPMIPVFLSKAGISLRKLSNLVEDLLNVSRLEKGHLILNKSQFNMYDAVAEHVENMQFTGTNNEVIQLSGDKSICVFADKYRIEQVLTNLLNNAVKYSPPASQIRIDISRVDGKSVKISVQDKGIGIPESNHERLFDRYYRVDYKGNHYSGLGLGLYISSEIIKKHSGEIGVVSQVNCGSTFWFTLPAE